jgi:hypothetical protein
MKRIVWIEKMVVDGRTAADHRRNLRSATATTVMTVMIRKKIDR